MNNVEICNMAIDDIAQVLQLEKSHNITILNENILKADLANSNNYYLVAKKDKKIIGYIGISHILDTADIIYIVVSKQETNKGIASMLLESIFDFGIKNNISKILLEVRKSNVIAQKLYIKHGFIKISERKKYYDLKEDAYIMEKKLPT